MTTLDHVQQVISGHFPQMEGWCPIDKGHRMARLVTELPGGRPVLCVELGVFGGRSLVALGLAVRHCRGGQGRVDGIDPYTVVAALEGQNDKSNEDWWSKVDYNYILGRARGAINSLGLGDVVKLKLSRSQDVVGDYEAASIDVLHQDSNHSELVSCEEVERWTPKMRPGGFWVFDDTNWATTKRAQGLLEAKGYRRLEQHDTWAVFQAP